MPPIGFEAKIVERYWAFPYGLYEILAVYGAHDLYDNVSSVFAAYAPCIQFAPLDVLQN